MSTHLLHSCPTSYFYEEARVAPPFITCYQVLSSLSGLQRLASMRDSIQPQYLYCWNCNSWFMLHNQFKSEGHLLYFIQLNVFPILTFLTYYYCRMDLNNQTNNNILNIFQRTLSFFIFFFRHCNITKIFLIMQ
jgi:hypothetical protein